MSTIVFSFARMNPITKGHERLIDKIKSVSKRTDAVLSVMYLSQTQDNKTNPLLWEHKLQLAQKCFPDTHFSHSKEVKTPYHALETICNTIKDSNIILVVGDDRVSKFKSMHKYALEWGAKSFDIVSAGERDPSSSSVKGISGQKARDLAIKGSYVKFAKLLPESLNIRYKQEVYNTIRETIK